MGQATRSILTQPPDYDDNQWYHGVFVVDQDNDTAELYIDGTKAAITKHTGCGTIVSNTLDISSCTVASVVNSEPLYLSRNGYSSSSIDATTDEIRLSNIARSADWIETSFNNQNTPGTFLSLDSEEVGPGPVGYWGFDEGYGSTTYDSSGQGNDGTISGATWQDESQCVAGKCLYFDGEDQTWVEADVQAAMENFSLCAWIKASSFTNSDSDDPVHILEKRWDLTLAGTGILRFRVATDSAYPAVYSSEAIELSKWHHVCNIFNGVGSNPEMYIDGVDVSSSQNIGSGTQEDDSSYDFDIGAASEWTSNYNGFIDEVKIYPYARTEDQVRQDYNAGLAGVSSNSGTAASFGDGSDKWMSDGLVGYWKMDEASWNGTSDEVVDASGNGNHGTALNEATTTTGKFGSGGNFDGSDDSVSIENFDPPHSGTVSFWINPDDSGNGRQRILGGANEYEITLEDSGKIESNFFVAASGVETPTVLQNDQWYSVIVSYDYPSNETKVYIDGDLEVETSDADTDPGGPFTLSLGRRTGTGDLYDGQIDELRIYNRVLSAREAKGLYQWAPGPVGHWKMDEKVAGDAQTLYDISGNDNHGTTEIGGNGTGMDCTALGKYGSACEFDGTDDYITANSMGAGMFATDSTVSAWLKSDVATGSWRGAVTQGGNYDGFWWLGFYNGNWQFYGDDGDQSMASASIVADRWYHVAVTRDSGGLTMYVDGRWLTQTLHLLKAIHTIYILEERKTTVNIWTVLSMMSVSITMPNQQQIIEDMNAGHPAGGSPVGSPIAYWKFSEGVGATAYDSVGDNDGTLEASLEGPSNRNRMWDLDGKFGKAIEFDGTDDYVEVADDDALDITDEYSISAWIYPTSWGEGTYGRILQKGNSSSNRYLFYINDFADTYTFSRDDTDYDSSNSMISLDNWHHVVVSFDGTTLKLFHNGIQDSNTYTPSALQVNGDPLYIGNNNAGDRTFEGLIDEVKVFNYAMDAEQVAVEYNQGAGVVVGRDSTRDNDGTDVSGAAKEYCIPGDSSPCDAPVLELNFDEKSGTTAFDTSGNGNDGTLTNGPIWTDIGKIGPALVFDGSDDYVEVADFASIAPENEITISLWANISDDGSLFRDETHADANRINAEIYTGDIYWDFGDRTGDGRTSYTPSTIYNAWHHLTFVSSTTGGYQKIYRNGILENTDNDSDSFTQYSGDLDISSRQSALYVPTGKIDQVKIYDYIRTPAQVAWDYNRGGPVGWWKMDEASGTQVDDWSGNGNHGTMTNMDPGTDRVAGKFGKALDFDGGNDYVQFDDAVVSEMPFSVCGWFNVPNTSRYSIVWIGDKDMTDQEWWLYTNGGYVVLRVESGTSADATSAVTHGFNQWHHACGVVSSATDRYIYLDGGNKGTNTGDISPFRSG